MDLRRAWFPSSINHMKQLNKTFHTLPLLERKQKCGRDLAKIRWEFKNQIRALWEDYHVMVLPRRYKKPVSMPSSFLAPQNNQKLIKPDNLAAISDRIASFTAREAAAVLLYSRMDFYLFLSVDRVHAYFPIAPLPTTRSAGGARWKPDRPEFGKLFFVDDPARVGLQGWAAAPLDTLLTDHIVLRKDRNIFAHAKGRVPSASGSSGKLVWTDQDLAAAFRKAEEVFLAASNQMEMGFSAHP